MEVFLDETGVFRPCAAGEIELATVMGLIIPEIDAQSLRRDYTAFVNGLPREYFQTNEPKGRLFPLEHQRKLISILNAHPGIMLVPVTFNRAISSPFFESWPNALRELLHQEAGKCIHLAVRREVQELAKRCGNLNGEQLARLLAYKVAVQKALDAICLFYHCKKYHSSYSPIRVVFDRTGRANNREELVFKEMMFVWITKNVMTSIKQIHTDSHPFVNLYGTRVDGKRAFDFSKMVRGNFEFRDSKTCWQLQIADALASAWINSVRDQNNTRGFLPLFRRMYRNSSLPKTQPVGLMNVAEVSSQVTAPTSFDIFQRLVAEEPKVLPCLWDG